MLRSRQLVLVAGLIAVGVVAVVSVMIASQGAGAATPGDALLQAVARIHSNGGRLMMLDEEEDPGAELPPRRANAMYRASG